MSVNFYFFNMCLLSYYYCNLDIILLPLWRKSYRRFKMGFKIMWNCCHWHFRQIWRIWNLIVLIKVYFQNKNNPLGCLNKISSFLVANKWFRVGLPPSKKVRFSAIKVLQNWWKVLFIYLKGSFLLEILKLMSELFWSRRKPTW